MFEKEKIIEKQNGITKDALLVGMILDALIALGYLGYSAVLVVLACTALTGWKAALVFSGGTVLFLRAFLHGGLFDSVSSILNTGTDKGKSKGRNL